MICTKDTKPSLTKKSLGRRAHGLDDKLKDSTISLGGSLEREGFRSANMGKCQQNKSTHKVGLMYDLVVVPSMQSLSLLRI